MTAASLAAQAEVLQLGRISYLPSAAGAKNARRSVLAVDVNTVDLIKIPSKIKRGLTISAERGVERTILIDPYHSGIIHRIIPVE